MESNAHLSRGIDPFANQSLLSYLPSNRSDLAPGHRINSRKLASAGDNLCDFAFNYAKITYWNDLGRILSRLLFTLTCEEGVL